MVVIQSVRDSVRKNGFNFNGANLRDLYAADMAECVRHCRDTERCVGISYRRSIYKCWLKFKRGGSIGPIESAEHISMNMECDNSPVTNLDCMREGFLFQGADLTNLVTADEEECVRHCRDTEDCVSLTFLESSRRCLLKSKRGGEAGPSVRPATKSMNMVCNNTAGSNLECLRDGIIFRGANITVLPAPDLAKCAQHCSDTDGCVSITYRDVNDECWLKSRRGGSIGPTLSAAHKSMNMDCDNSAVTNMDCLREGIAFPGADLSSLVSADEEECVRHCRDTEGCVALAFRETIGRCFLKSQRGGQSGPGVVVAINSMNMECNSSAVTDLNCWRDGLYFNGAFLKDIAVIDEEECVQHCRDTEKCVSITLGKETGRCTLKSERGGSKAPTPSDGHKSMNMECDNSAVTNLNCTREGIDFFGADIGKLVTVDIEECVRRCRDTESCVSIAFEKSIRKCFLKNKRGGLRGPTLSTTRASMNMECDNSAVTNMDCMRKGIDFPGADIKNLVTADEEECVRHCRDTEDCVSITFQKSKRKCRLKYKRGGSNGPTVSTGYRSMNMECDNSAVTNLGCMRENIDFPGANLTNLETTDEEECVRHCRDTEGCVALSFRISDQTCFLKSRRGGESGPVGAVNTFRSMNMECQSDFILPQVTCMKDNYSFPSADIWSIVVPDFADCIVMCADTEGCMALTYNKLQYECTLKNKVFKKEDRQYLQNFQSTNMMC